MIARHAFDHCLKLAGAEEAADPPHGRGKGIHDLIQPIIPHHRDLLPLEPHVVLTLPRFMKSLLPQGRDSLFVVTEPRRPKGLAMSRGLARLADSAGRWQLGAQAGR